MMIRVIVGLLLIFGVGVQAQTLIETNNLQSGLDNPIYTAYGPAGTFRFTYTVMDTATNPIALNSGNTYRLKVFAADSKRIHNLTNDTGEIIYQELGQLRFTIPALVSGTYRVQGVVTPVGGDTNANWYFTHHLLEVTNAATAGSTTINIDPQLDFAFSGVTSTPRQVRFWSGGTISTVVLNGANADIYLQDLTSGSVVSNVTRGASNHYNAATGELMLGTNDYPSYVESEWASTTAQAVADLPRSTADYEVYQITWAPTVTVLRANGIFQALTLTSNTWVSIPAGVSNMGYTIRLDVPATTNLIEFLPANLIISTNLNLYTNAERAMVFLIDNAFSETGSAIYSLPRIGE